MYTLFTHRICYSQGSWLCKRGQAKPTSTGARPSLPFLPFFQNTALLGFTTKTRPTKGASSSRLSTTYSITYIRRLISHSEKAGLVQNSHATHLSHTRTGARRYSAKHKYHGHRSKDGHRLTGGSSSNIIHTALSNVCVLRCQNYFAL